MEITFLGDNIVGKNFPYLRWKLAKTSRQFFAGGSVSSIHIRQVKEHEIDSLWYKSSSVLIYDTGNFFNRRVDRMGFLIRFTLEYHSLYQLSATKSISLILSGILLMNSPISFNFKLLLFQTHFKRRIISLNIYV